MIIEASEIKKRGVLVFDEVLKEDSEVIIEYNGKKKFIVLDYDEYQKFKEYQLQKAYQEAMEDIKSGNYEVVSAKEHIERLKKELENV